MDSENKPEQLDIKLITTTIEGSKIYDLTNPEHLKELKQLAGYGLAEKLKNAPVTDFKKLDLETLENFLNNQNEIRN
mgnify:CR=1 FL=1